MDAGAEQSLTARTFPPKLLVGPWFVSTQGDGCTGLPEGGGRIGNAARLRNSVSLASEQHAGFH